MLSIPAFSLNGRHPAERVYAHQAIKSEVYLRGDPAPTRNQVGAVLHALADFTHNQHMLGEDVAALGDRDESFGATWVHATGLGRYFHRLGDHLQTYPPLPELAPDYMNETVEEEDARLTAASELRAAALAGQVEKLEDEMVGASIAGALAALLPRDASQELHANLITVMLGIIALRDLDAE